MPFITVKLLVNGSTQSYFQDNKYTYPNVFIVVNGLDSIQEIKSLRKYTNPKSKNPYPARFKMELVPDEVLLEDWSVVRFKLRSLEDYYIVNMEQAQNEAMKVINNLDRMGYSVVAQSSNIFQDSDNYHFIYTLKKR